MIEFLGFELPEDYMENLKTLEIKRFEHESDQANRSCQFYEGDFIGFGLECPNLNNEPFKSRINAGTYYANKVKSDERGEFWLLEDANGRDGIILNHIANTVLNVEGCVGFGLCLDTLFTERAITFSAKACKEFMKLTDGETRLRVIIT